MMCMRCGEWEWFDNALYFATNVLKRSLRSSER
jgi:hypothetical protein